MIPAKDNHDRWLTTGYDAGCELATQFPSQILNLDWSTMAGPPNICVFCGKIGNSKEHLWGKWAKQHLPSNNTMTYHELWRPLVLGSNLPIGTVKSGPYSRQGRLISQQVKGACRKCNNTWMKNVHERAAPYLVRLSKSEWWPLNASEKIAVASYFTLVSMMWQLADRATMATTQEERTYFYTTQTPPPNWCVFIAEYEDGIWNENLIYIGFSAYSSRNAPPKHADCHTLVSTFGKVAFNTLSISPLAPEDFKAGPPAYALRHGLQAIWPLNGSIIRKPPRPHTDGELYEIAHHHFSR